ncbi:MAG TPA: methionyl-tRNA formyltransferase [Pyrinomonadaceae bacterium]|jgi:methionyl-tRNA formyltransferase|nr:methionyl-tRNA formyltransferase [Pyrinomonadaceae bacterium]
MSEDGRIGVALLCAGEIGYRCLRRVVESRAARLAAVFSYRVEPPQGEYLEKILDLARSRGAPAHDVAGFRQEQFRAALEGLDLDLLVAVKWRTMIPQGLIEAARGGLVVFHASLLPKYRGFAPVNWPLINGERETGVTMFYAADEVDAGDIIEQRARAITDEDDAGTLDAWLNETVERMLEENLPRLAGGTAPRVPQDHSRATYAIWREPEDGRIDWGRPTREVFNLVRGLASPYPGAFSVLEGRKLVIWSAEIEREPRAYVGRNPGKVERIIPGEGVNVLTGDGTLRIKRVQLEGDEPRRADEVIRRLKTRLL